MMLDVIITAWHMHDTIERAIGSVIMQNRDDVMITVVDDADEKPYDDIVNKYKPIFGDRIRLLRKPNNTGCGPSRQYGIDHTTCEYITFLDADDCYITPIALESLISNAKLYNADIVSSAFIEQTDSNSFVTHQNDRTWMHGKIYKADFLRYNNIRFNMSRANEDSAFNVMCYALCGMQVHIDLATYMWMNNPNSLVRSGDWLSNTICVFVDNATYACTELAKRKLHPDKLAANVVGYAVTMYGYYCKFTLANKSDSFMDKYMEHVKRFWKKADANKLISRAGDNALSEQMYSNSITTGLFSQKAVLPISFSEFAKKAGGRK